MDGHSANRTPFSTTGSGDMLADRRFDMALQFFERGDFEAAADLMAQAREIAPHWPPAAFRHAEILGAWGRMADAGAAFDAYLAMDPADIMGAAIKLALLGLRPAPSTLPDGYIAGLFDEYAPRFDRHLTETLMYDVPQTLASLVDEIRSGGTLRILDLGCGTGLAGEALLHRKSWLEGIDLSPRMIAAARDKNIYDALHTGDMIAWMRTRTDKFDLVVAADVLIYTGDLRPAFAAARPRLADDGLFVFSLQDGAAAGTFTLRADHRYTYDESYVRACAADTGFDVKTIRRARLRRDAGHDVPGLICALA